MARGSLWTRLNASAARMPELRGRPVMGIIRTIVGTGEGGLDRIGGISYRAVMGHEHPLDGQSIDFGEHGIERDQVPSPWRELLDGARRETTFPKPFPRGQ